MDFLNKTAIASGAASGMGLLFSENFASLGGNVVMCDVNEKLLEEKVAEINAKDSGRAIGVVCDVRDYSQVCAVKDRAVAERRKRQKGKTSDSTARGRACYCSLYRHCWRRGDDRVCSRRSE